jgi:hypothetical protein
MHLLYGQAMCFLLMIMHITLVSCPDLDLVNLGSILGPALRNFHAQVPDLAQSHDKLTTGMIHVLAI